VLGLAGADDKVTTGTAHTGFLAKQTVNGGWTGLKTAFHKDQDTNVSYCLEHTKDYANGQAYESYGGPDARTKSGIVAILQHGYPTVDPPGISKIQAQYATQNAIRSWLAERGQSHSYAFMKLSEKRVKSSGASWDATFAWYKKLVKYAQDNDLLKPTITIVQEGSWRWVNGQYATKLRVKWADGQKYKLTGPAGYNLDTLLGSDKVSVTSSNDTIDILVPASVMGKKLTFTAQLYDTRAAASFHWWKPAKDTAKQKVVTVKLVDREAKVDTVTCLPPSASVRVVKTDATNGLPLAGAVFTLRDSAGKVWTMPATNNAGISALSGLPWGSYVLRETKAPLYFLTAPDRTLTLTGAVETKVADWPAPSRCRLRKVDSETGEPLSGAQFRLTKGSVTGGTVESGLDGWTPWLNTTAGEGYYLQEIRVPSGYKGDGKKIAMTLQVGDNQTVVKNTPATGLRLLKVDADDEDIGLGGALFSFERMDPGHVNLDLDYAEMYVGQEQSVALDFVNLPSREVTLTSSDETIVRVGEDYRLEALSAGETTLTVVSPYDREGQRARIELALSVVQTDTSSRVETSVATTSTLASDTVLPDVETTSTVTTITIPFVWPESPLSASCETTRFVPLEELTTDHNGYAYAAHSYPPGLNYVLCEVRAPAGYLREPAPIPVTLIEGEVTEVMAHNKRLPYIDLVKEDLDTGRGLDRTDFALYWDASSEEATEAVWQLIAKGTTDTEGRLSFELPTYGDYKVVETAPHPDYASSIASGQEGEQYFTLVPDGPAPRIMVFRNKRLFTAVEVDKQTIAVTSAAYRSLPGQADIDNTAAGCAEQYRYDVDYRSLSNTWADELVVDDPLEAVDANQIRVAEVWTPIVWGDADGHFNLWYQTNETSATVNYSALKAADGDVDNPANPLRLQRFPNTGWKLWAADIGARERRHLRVADLELTEGEYLSAIRLEHGRVERGFTTRNSGLWTPTEGDYTFSADALAATKLQPLSYLVCCPNYLSQTTTVTPTWSDSEEASTSILATLSLEDTETVIASTVSAHITRNIDLYDDAVDDVETRVVSSFAYQPELPTPPQSVLYAGDRLDDANREEPSVHEAPLDMLRTGDATSYLAFVIAALLAAVTISIWKKFR
jgi:hypothetical protein